MRFVRGRNSFAVRDSPDERFYERAERVGDNCRGTPDKKHFETGEKCVFLNDEGTAGTNNKKSESCRNCRGVESVFCCTGRKKRHEGKRTSDDECIKCRNPVFKGASMPTMHPFD